MYFSQYTACNYFAGRWSDLRSEKKFPISEAIHSLECVMIYIFRNIPSLVLTIFGHTNTFAGMLYDLYFQKYSEFSLTIFYYNNTFSQMLYDLYFQKQF